MALLEFLMGDRYDPHDDDLATPGGAEVGDLELHVQRCALRYRQLRKGQHANTRKLNLVLAMVAAEFLILLASNLLELDRLLELMF